MTERKMVYVNISDKQKRRMDVLKEKAGMTIQFITDKVFATNRSLNGVLSDLEKRFEIKSEEVG